MDTLLLKGMDPNAVMAELFGKSTGCSKGKGGSMHMWSNELGYAGRQWHCCRAIANCRWGGFRRTISGTRDIVRCAFFGDGAVDEGAFHESLNLASLWKLPSCLYLRKQPVFDGHGRCESLGRRYSLLPRAAAYNMPGEQVDGMDVVQGV